MTFEGQFNFMTITVKAGLYSWLSRTVSQHSLTVAWKSQNSTIVVIFGTYPG